MALKSNQKIKVKYYLLGGMLLLPAILGIVALFVKHSSENSVMTKLSNSSGALSSPLSSVNKSQTESYKGNDYSLDYPKNWTKNVKKVADSDDTIFLLQPKTNSSSKTPHFAIQIINRADASIDIMSDRYKALGFKEEEVPIAGGVMAKKLSGSLKTSQGVLHSITYFFVHKGKLHIIKTGYRNDKVDEQLEKQFAQIVATLTMN